MSGQPPPNYDPGQSLLGGAAANADIVPVMGGGGGDGGGSAPPNYNPDQSLLQTGAAVSAPILPVQGGGTSGSGLTEEQMKERTIEAVLHGAGDLLAKYSTEPKLQAEAMGTGLSAAGTRLHEANSRGETVDDATLEGIARQAIQGYMDRMAASTTVPAPLSADAALAKTLETQLPADLTAKLESTAKTPEQEVELAAATAAHMVRDQGGTQQQMDEAAALAMDKARPPDSLFLTPEAEKMLLQADPFKIPDAALAATVAAGAVSGVEAQLTQVGGVPAGIVTGPVAQAAVAAAVNALQPTAGKAAATPAAIPAPSAGKQAPSQSQGQALKEEARKSILSAEKPEDIEAAKELDRLADKTLAKEATAKANSPAPAPAASAAAPAPPCDKTPVEFYKVPRAKQYFISLLRRRRNDLEEPTFKVQIQGLMYDYEKRNRKNWARTLKKGETEIQTPLPLAGSIQGADPKELLHNRFAVLSASLPDTIETVIVCPAPRGNVLYFMNVMNMLQDFGVLTVDEAYDTFTIDPRVAVVFLNPFFRPLSYTNEFQIRRDQLDNLVLLYMYLSVERQNPNNIFALTDLTAENYTVSEVFNTFRDAPTTTDMLPTFLEPSLLSIKTICPPGKRIYISATRNTLDLPIFPQAEAVGLVADPNNPENPNRVPGHPKYYTTVLPSDISKVKERAAPEDFKILTKQEDTDTFQNSFPELTPAEAGICDALVSKTTLQELSEKRGGATEFRLVVDLSGQAFHCMAIRLKGQTEPLCYTKHKGDIRPPQKIDKFYGRLPATLRTQGVQFTRVEFSGQVFTLRIPTDSNGVYDDWLAAKYTADEANFLNSLHLRPRMMPDIFPPDKVILGDQKTTTTWEGRVADFLKLMVSSQCMQNDGLLLRSECVRAREFMDTVYMYFVEHESDLQNLEVREKDEYQRELERYQEDLRLRSLEGLEKPADVVEIRPGLFKQIPPTYNRSVKTYYYKGFARANIIAINKYSGISRFYSVVVPQTNDAAADTMALQQKVQTLAGNNTSYHFIY